MNLSTVGNRNEYSTKQIVSLQPDYVSSLPDKTKSSTKTANRLLHHSHDCSKILQSRSVLRFFPYLLEHSFSSLPTKIFYILIGFIKNLSSNVKWLILTCKRKLSCRDMRRVTVMTSSS